MNPRGFVSVSFSPEVQAAGDTESELFVLEVSGACKHPHSILQEGGQRRRSHSSLIAKSFRQLAATGGEEKGSNVCFLSGS